jgi:hypothetical protein
MPNTSSQGVDYAHTSHIPLVGKYAKAAKASLPAGPAI